MKPKVIHPELFSVVSGQSEYVIDVPDGDCQLDYWIMSDGWCTLYLSSDAHVMPLECGYSISGRCLVRGAKALIVKAAPTAAVAIRVFHSEATVADPIDDKPIAVAIPEPQQIPLSELIGRVVADRVRAEVAALTGKEPEDLEVDVDDLLEDLPPDIDEEFGPGHMEMDDDGPLFDELARGRTPDPERLRAERQRGKSESTGVEGESGSRTDGDNAGDREQHGDRS